MTPLAPGDEFVVTRVPGIAEGRVRVGDVGVVLEPAGTPQQRAEVAARGLARVDIGGWVYFWSVAHMAPRPKERQDMTAVTDARGRCAACDAEVYLNAPHICSGGADDPQTRVAQLLGDKCRLEARVAQLEARCFDLDTELLSKRQQAHAWEALWDQLRRGNEDFHVGQSGRDAALAEVARLQGEAKEVHAARLRAEIAERSHASALERGDELRADRDRWRSECLEAQRQHQEAVSMHAAEQKAHKSTRREVAAWVGAYRGVCAKARDDLRDARRYRYLRSAGSEWAPFFSELTGSYGDGRNCARLGSRYVDGRFDEAVDAGMLAAPSAWRCDTSVPYATAVAPPSGSADAKRFLVPIELDVPSGWEAKMTDFRTVRLSRKEHERGCCCAECRAKVM